MVVDVPVIGDEKTHGSNLRGPLGEGCEVRDANPS
jgi:hypothetical protein